MDLPWIMYYCLILGFLKNSEAQTSDDKYIITSSRSTSYDLYIYPGDASAMGKPYVRTPIGNNLILNLETNTASAAIYYLDLESKCMYNVTNFASPSATLNKMHCGISRSLGSTIAFDWITGNMYWSDGIFHWIVLQPITTTDIHMYKKVISGNIKDISALAIEPIKRYIFWFDLSPSGPRIERASLAGLNRKVILTTGFTYVSDIVADVQTNRIFWVDQQRFSIESANYEGLERKIFYKELNNEFYALAVDTEYVCMTLPTTTHWMCAQKTTGELKYIQPLNQSKPYGIAIFNKAMQPVGQDYCAAANCEHLCVNGDVNAICMCKEGYHLNLDQRSCTANHTLFGSGILLSYDQMLCMVDFRAINHGTGIYLNTFLPGLQGITHIATDSANLQVFFTDSVKQEIKSYGIVDKNVRILQTFTGNVSGLSFDWLQKKLYWCESNTGLIRRVSTENGIRETFADTKLEAQGVTVDPYSRTVFWIQQKNKILSSSMSNGNVQTVIKQGGLKSGLFFDVHSYRIFWIEFSTIQSMKIDGTDIQIRKTAKQGSPLLVYKSHAVWVNAQLQLGTIPLSTDQSEPILVSFPNHGRITALSIFDVQDQPQKRDACDNDNDKCDHICIPTDTGQVCRCEFGFTLDTDNKTCLSVPFSQRFMLTTDLVLSRIYQVSLDTGETRGLEIPFVDRPAHALYDANAKLIYWTDANNDKIYSSQIEKGEDVYLLYTSEAGTYPQSITIDPTTQNLFFSISDSKYKETAKGKVCVLNTITLQSKTLVTSLGLVKGLVLFPSKGVLFFLDEQGTHSGIYSAPMDGSNKILLTFSSRNPINAFTVDTKNSRLFWSVSREIRTSDITGKHIQTFLATDGNIRYMMYTSSHLYYCSDKQQKIVKIDLTTKQTVNWMSDAPELGLLVSLDITPKESVEVHKLCANRNGQCSTFCLPRHSSRTCACQDGVKISSDGKTCTGVLKCSDSMAFGSLESECQRYPSETCKFTCNKGYTATAAIQSVLCQQNSSWNYDLTTLCASVRQCPDDFDNGSLDGNCRRHPDETCSFSCDSGYSPKVKPQTVICQQNSSWNHNLSDICALSRQCPDDFANGSLDGNCRRHPNETCSFSCDSGYSPKVKPQTVICQQNSSWNHNLSNICVLKCSDSMAFGFLESECQRYPSETCKFTCNKGYTATAAIQSVLCQQNSSWNYDLTTLCALVRQCPDDFANGSFDGNCRRHPNAVFPVILIINASNRNMPAKKFDICGKKCQDEIQYGSLDKNCGRFPNDTCSFICDVGYSSKVPLNKLLCKRDSSWDHNISDICVLQCEEQVKFGSLVDDCQRFPTETCAFTCADKYMSRLSPQTVTCQQNSTWNHDLSTICLVTCDDSILNGKINQSCLRIAGASCSYSCNPGYERSTQHPLSVTCLISGTWNYQPDLLCTKKGKCDTKVPNGGLIDCKAPRVGESCMYYCNENYERKKGLSSIACTSEGTWTQNIGSLCQMTVETPQGSGQDDTFIALIAGLSSGIGFVAVTLLVLLIYKFGRRNGNANSGEPATGNDLSLQEMSAIDQENTTAKQLYLNDTDNDMRPSSTIAENR